MTDFEKLMDFVLKWEGRTFEDDPDDPGGATKFGIDIRTLRSDAKKGAYQAFLKEIGVRLPVDRESIRMLSERQARAIYERSYWRPLDRWQFPRLTRAAMFDASVNCGFGRAVKCLQRHVGVDDDGVMGPVTCGAFRRLADYDLARGVIEERELFYRRLANQRPAMKKFLKGWLNRAADLKTFLRTY